MTGRNWTGGEGVLWLRCIYEPNTCGRFAAMPSCLSTLSHHFIMLSVFLSVLEITCFIFKFEFPKCSNSKNTFQLVFKGFWECFCKQLWERDAWIFFFFFLFAGSAPSAVTLASISPAQEEIVSHLFLSILMHGLKESLRTRVHFPWIRETLVNCASR